MQNFPADAVDQLVKWKFQHQTKRFSVAEFLKENSRNYEAWWKIALRDYSIEIYPQGSHLGPVMAILKCAEKIYFCEDFLYDRGQNSYEHVETRMHRTNIALAKDLNDLLLTATDMTLQDFIGLVVDVCDLYERSDHEEYDPKNQFIFEKDTRYAYMSNADKAAEKRREKYERRDSREKLKLNCIQLAFSEIVGASEISEILDSLEDLRAHLRNQLPPEEDDTEEESEDDAEEESEDDVEENFTHNTDKPFMQNLLSGH